MPRLAAAVLSSAACPPVGSTRGISWNEQRSSVYRGIYSVQRGQILSGVVLLRYNPALDENLPPLFYSLFPLSYKTNVDFAQ